MKKYIIFLLIIAALPPALAQVGINTTNPLGVFHVDAKGNSPATISDDVIVDSNGNLGLGTLSPSAKVDLTVATGNKALRIDDGVQAEGRILLSDANGNAKWGVIKGTGGYAMDMSTTMSFPHGKGTWLPLDGVNTRINLVSSGNYLITIRWWGRTTVVGPAGTVSAYYTLFKNGSAVDGIEYYVPMKSANSPITFTTSLMASNCNAGDYLEVMFNPSVGGQAWTISTASGNLLPSVVVFRM